MATTEQHSSDKTIISAWVPNDVAAELREAALEAEGAGAGPGGPGRSRFKAAATEVWEILSREEALTGIEPPEDLGEAEV